MQNRQTEQTAALYCRVANRNGTDGLNLDNQMQKLLCYARERGLRNFLIYADLGASGLTLDRPALNALKADIEAGRVDTVIVRDVTRIARGFLLAENFISWAGTHGANVFSITDGALLTSLFAVTDEFPRSLPKGGGRV
jgi:DNA invertase Pin-like site-specific DNA recombinase